MSGRNNPSNPSRHRRAKPAPISRKVRTMAKEIMVLTTKDALELAENCQDLNISRDNDSGAMVEISHNGQTLMLNIPCALAAVLSLITILDGEGIVMRYDKYVVALHRNLPPMIDAFISQGEFKSELTSFLARMEAAYDAFNATEDVTPPDMPITVEQIV